MTLKIGDECEFLRGKQVLGSAVVTAIDPEQKQVTFSSVPVSVKAGDSIRLKTTCWNCSKPIPTSDNPQTGQFCSNYCADAAEFDRRLL